MFLLPRLPKGMSKLESKRELFNVEGHAIYTQVIEISFWLFFNRKEYLGLFYFSGIWFVKWLDVIYNALENFYYNIIILVCHLLRSGVAALFGPQSGTTSSHVQSICDAMEIPHIETRWDYRLKRDDYSVNLYPHPTAISKVRWLPW